MTAFLAADPDRGMSISLRIFEQGLERYQPYQAPHIKPPHIRPPISSPLPYQAPYHIKPPILGPPYQTP